MTEHFAYTPRGWVKTNGDAEDKWAPSPQDTEKTRAWLLGVLNDTEDLLPYEGDPMPERSDVIERLLWLQELDGRLTAAYQSITWNFHADQWVGVRCEAIRRDGSTLYLWTEGDYFLLAIAKTMEKLKQAI